MNPSQDHLPHNSFYITGGTLPLHAPSYVPRHADTQLLDGLQQGHFCYVLNTRQMGKSSLTIRTALRLQEQGCRVAILDLTAIGHNLSVDQWYFGLLGNLALQVGREDELLEFWRTHREWGPMQRFVEALRRILLVAEPLSLIETGSPPFGADDEAIPAPPVRPLVVFVDEIDAVRSLPFSVDEFFAGIRECYNRRTHDEAFGRLTFCLLGVAAPTDLIRDTRISPFNIGKRIELSDFTPEEAEPLARGLTGGDDAGPSGSGGRVGLSGRALRLLRRVLHWTGGHPYMTQRLCQAVAARLAEGAVSVDNAKAEAALVDDLCARLFLSKVARETDDNLAFVRNRLLSSEVDVAALLDLYGQVRAGKRVRDDETNPLCSVLRLSGVVKVENGLLRIRNRIYVQVFDRQWARASLPNAELQRQRRAYRLGILRTAALAAVVLVIIGGLAGVALRNARRAATNANRANANEERAKQETETARSAQLRADASARDSNAATEQAVSSAFRATQEKGRADAKAHEADVKAKEAARSLLQAEAAGKREAHARQDADRQRQRTNTQLSRAYVEAGERLIGTGDYGAALDPFVEAMALDRSDHQRMRLHRLRFASALALAPRIDRMWFAGGSLRWAAYSPDKRWVAAAGEDGQARLWETSTGKQLPLTIRRQGSIGYAAFSPDGTKLVTCGDDRCACLWDMKARRLLCTLHHPPEPDGHNQVTHASWSRDGHRLATAYRGLTLVWDVEAIVAQAARTGREIDAYSDQRPFVLTKHESPGADSVESVLSPDGNYLAVAANNDIGALLRVPDDHTRYTIGLPGLGGCFHGSHAAFSSDGKRLLFAGAFGPRTTYGGACVFDIHHFVPQEDVPGSAKWAPWLLQLSVRMPHEGKALFAAFSPDERCIVTAGNDHTGRVWDAVTGQPLTPPLQHEEPVTHAEFSPDGKRVITASDDSTARIWDAETGAAVCAPLRHAGAVVAAQFGDDGDHVLTASLDGSVRLWTLPPAVPASTVLPRTYCYFMRHEDNRYCILAKYLFYNGSSPNVRCTVVDITTGKQLFPTTDSTTEFSDFGASLDGRRIVFYGSKLHGVNNLRDVQVWDAEHRKPLSPLLQSDGAILSPDGRLLALIDRIGNGEYSTVRIVDAVTGTLQLAPVRSELIRVWGDNHFTPDGHDILVPHGDHAIILLNARTGRPVTKPMTHDQLPYECIFSPDSRYLFTWTKENLLRIWNVATGTPALLPVSGISLLHYGGARRVEFSPDRRYAIMPATDCALIWRLDGSTTLQPRRLAIGNYQVMNFLDKVFIFSPDGETIGVRGTGRWLWNVRTGASITPRLDQGVKLEDAAFSPDGRLVLTTYDSGAARIWDVRTRQPITPLLLHDRMIYIGVFSKDGNMVATAGNGSVRIWDVATGLPLTPPLAINGDVRQQLEFASDGRRLIGASNTECRIWTLPLAAESLDRLRCRAQLLSGQHLDVRIGKTVPVDPAMLRQAWEQVGGSLPH